MEDLNEKLLVLALFLVVVWPLCRIMKKTGHHPLIGLFFFLPGINIVMLYIIAKGKWPIEYECEALVSENDRLKQTIEKSEQSLGGDS